jgi:hypothetical protein
MNFKAKSKKNSYLKVALLVGKGTVLSLGSDLKVVDFKLLGNYKSLFLNQNFVHFW